MGCESGCFEFEVAGCDSFVLPVGLAAMTPYTVKLSRPGSNVIYERSVTAGADGHLTLVDFPDGLFNRGEVFKITVSGSDGEVIPFLIEGETYECLQAKIIESV